nr:MAG TPA: hypothetical protein [Caudoviricetes sp.]
MPAILLIWKNCNLSHPSSFHSVRPDRRSVHVLIMHQSSPPVKLTEREPHHTNKCPNIGRPVVLTKGLPINMPYRRPTTGDLRCQTKSCDT